MRLKHLTRKEGKYHKAEAESSAGQLVTGRTKYWHFPEMSLDYKENTVQWFFVLLYGARSPVKRLEKEGRAEAVHMHI